MTVSGQGATGAEQEPATARASLGGRLFLGILCLYLVTGHGFIENADSEVSFQTTRALVTRGSTELLATDGPVVAGLLAAKEGQGHGVAWGPDGRAFGWFGIGHALWQVPFFLAGQGLSQLFAGLEARYAKQPWALEEFSYGSGILGDAYLPRLLVSLSHPLAGALACLVLFSIGTLLGLRPLLAARIVLLYGLGSMAWPFSRESLSDGPGALLLLCALRDSIAWARGRGGERLLARAGLCAGAAVTVRAMLGLCLIPLGAYVLAWAWRRRSARALVVFGEPLLWILLALMAFNWWRFGNPLESGYGAQADRAFFSFPPILGLFLIGFALGKGLVPFNLPLLGLLALPGAKRRPPGPEAALFFGLLACLAVPCSFAAGWHGGWSWGPRYLLPAVGPLVLLSGFAWEELRHRGRPMRWLVQFSALGGVLVAVGGVLSPVHGWWAAAFHSVGQAYPGKADPENLVFVLPRYSPLHGQWRYFAANLSGRFQAGGSPGLSGAWFGRELSESSPPRSRQLTGFRHLWAVDASFRFGSRWPMVISLGLLVFGAVSLLGRTGPIRCREGPRERP